MSAQSAQGQGCIYSLFLSHIVSIEGKLETISSLTGSTTIFLYTEVENYLKKIMNLHSLDIKPDFR